MRSDGENSFHHLERYNMTATADRVPFFWIIFTVARDTSKELPVHNDLQINTSALTEYTNAEAAQMQTPHHKCKQSTQMEVSVKGY